MDGTGQSGPMVPPQQQNSNLIRTDQVQKLPHLTEQQKLQHTQLVRTLWDTLNTRDPSTNEYNTAHMKLSQLSQSLMKGMRMYQQNRTMQAHQQQAQAQAAQAQAHAQAQAQNVAPQGQPVQRTQSSNPQSLNQLLPQIQAKVSALNFYLPPNVTQEQLQTWIPEARLRYGIALQKQEVGRVRMTELRQQYAARTAQGNITSEEVPDFKNRQLAAEKLYREGSDFLAKFKEQQEGFKMQASGSNGPIAMSQPAAAQSQPVLAAATPVQTPSNQTPNAGQSQAPAPHTINSAVNAARQNSVMSPSVSQAGQPPSGSPVGTTPASATQPLTQRSQAPSQPGASGAQVTFSQTPNLEGATPTSTGPAQIHQGPPRPLSASAALHQSAQSYSNPNTSQQPQQQNMNQAVNNQQAQPQGYLGNRATDTSARNNNMAIPKTLNVPTPEPVSMPAVRPTLSGGPNHASMGMSSQPAIQKHPGYVLEGEGQHVLSKKMLDILVRQVTGGGENEMLTPDAEEFMLQMADDFVDDLVVQACRLAKLRPSATLEIRDIQLVLEKNYNMRISGFSSDDLRTVKKPQPAQGWLQKMSAVQAAKVTQGRTE
ncbi:hypothetical protein N7495_009475 [Penicillium taxi]|uniref:uncharacterized protein n=1 Tax=Penicillium taxi TaxID=168475 RepID=UPI0025455459|nr:uncharacterized protein N7495_009475 [Penicillium taxi]KAJ5884965.1 hypothetical protein N7495_009475 [Penicillium taxi]